MIVPTLSKTTLSLLLASTLTLSSAASATTTTSFHNDGSSSSLSSSSSSSGGQKLLHYPIMPHSEVIKRNHRERNRDRSLNQERDLDQRDTDPYYSFNSTLEVGGLYQGYGTHYVDLWVGTPPQRQTVIVDTGSGITAFPCSGCSNCGADYHADIFFQEEKSSTFQKFSCNQCVGARCSNSGGRPILDTESRACDLDARTLEARSQGGAQIWLAGAIPQGSREKAASGNDSGTGSLRNQGRESSVEGDEEQGRGRGSASTFGDALSNPC